MTGWTRAFLVAVALASSGAGTAHAQPAPRVYRIGMLETVSIGLNAANVEAFRAGLSEYGWVEGKNLVIEYRSADGRPERFPALATDLVQRNVDVIVARGAPAVLAAKRATSTIPIVMATIVDPRAVGVIADLARPGGNVTGLTTVTAGLAEKRLALLKEAVPTLTKVAVLVNPSNPFVAASRGEREAAARALALQLVFVEFRAPGDFERAFAEAVRQGADGAVVTLDPVTQAHRRRIVELANSRRLPSIYPEREFAEAGGLLSYSVSHPAAYRRAALFVDKILRGALPGDLPVEEPTKFALVVNLKTARALGLALPSSLLLVADQVIQ
jgi:putative ABC transport system substrate-binding protein